jgi:hypothetical protein
MLRVSLFRMAALSATMAACGGVAVALPPAQQGLTAPTSSRDVSEDPVLKGPVSAAEAPLKRPTGYIGTLLNVRDPQGGAGYSQYVRITATAAAGEGGVPDSLGYDRFLGPLTMKSLGSIMQATTTVSKGWPKGQKIVLTFSEHPAPVELDAATLAGTLLLDSMIRDWDIEPTFAAIGSMRPNGEIEPVEAMSDRLYAAGRARVGRLAVPVKNEKQVADFLLSQGIAAFVGTQILTVANFEEAKRFAGTTLDDDTKEMLTLFGAVQRTLAASGANGVALLRNERVQATLKQVLEKAPNHLSAKVLYDWGTGKRTAMSLDGSIDYIDRGAVDLIRAMRAKQAEALSVQKQALADNIARLRYVHERLDPQAQGYAMALLKLGDVIQRAVGMSSRAPSRLSPSLQKDFDTARSAAQEEWTKMAQARVNGPAPGQ